MEPKGVRCGRLVVLGKDARLVTAAQILYQAGWVPLPPEKIREAQVVLMGTPTPSLEPFAAQLVQLPAGVPVFAGAVSAQAQQQAAALGLALVDYMESEELALFNAVPTAEGAIAILLNATSETLWRSRVLLVGYGRIAHVLAPRLMALGVQVTVAARRSAARMQARTMGCDTVDIDALPDAAAQTQFLINTVPYRLVTEETLTALPPDAFVLELAGTPGGVDLAAAQRLNVRVQTAPGLPGKCAPAAAGRGVGYTVIKYLNEHGFDAADPEKKE